MDDHINRGSLAALACLLFVTCISMDIIWLMMVNHNLGGCTVNIWLILMVMMMVNDGS